MIKFQTANGKIAIPIEEYDKIQNQQLREIKFNKREIVDFDKLTAYYPEVRFKNVVRKNDDDTFDIIINSSVAREINTGFLSKRFYQALKMKKTKGILGSESWSFVDKFQATEKEIVNEFVDEFPISEVEHILNATIKKGVNYFG